MLARPRLNAARDTATPLGCDIEHSALLNFAPVEPHSCPDAAPHIYRKERFQSSGRADNFAKGPFLNPSVDKKFWLCNFQIGYMGKGVGRPGCFVLGVNLPQPPPCRIALLGAFVPLLFFGSGFPFGNVHVIEHWRRSPGRPQCGQGCSPGYFRLAGQPSLPPWSFATKAAYRGQQTQRCTTLPPGTRPSDRRIYLWYPAGQQRNACSP